MKNSKYVLHTIKGILAEAKKKKKKKDDKDVRKVAPKEYTYADSFDFSAPQGDGNRYKMQGAASWGPLTGAPDEWESVVRKSVKEMAEPSAWNRLSESSGPGNVWEAASHWYDHQGLGLGHQTAEGIEAKKKKLANKKKKGSKK